MNTDPFQQLQKRLDETEEFPCYYVFKFIMPIAVRDQLTALLGSHPFTSRDSSKGNYVSITAEIFAGSSEEVIDLYRKATQIEGLIAL